MKIYYHGTTSKKALEIQSQGLRAKSYLTTSLEDAEYYAKTGGEWELQQREELWEQEHGEKARDHYYPDLEDMYKALYPQDCHPVVIKFTLMEVSGISDSGAENALETVDHIDPAMISEIILVKW